MNDASGFTHLLGWIERGWTIPYDYTVSIQRHLLPTSLPRCRDIHCLMFGKEKVASLACFQTWLDEPRHSSRADATTVEKYSPIPQFFPLTAPYSGHSSPGCFPTYTPPALALAAKNAAASPASLPYVR